MFYSYTDWKNEISPSCIWRATASGDYPNKKWTEDKKPVTCTSSEDLEDSGAPYAIDPAVFYDENNKPWMVYGSHWSGIWVVQLDENNTGKIKNHDGYYYIDNESLYTNIAKGP